MADNVTVVLTRQIKVSAAAGEDIVLAGPAPAFKSLISKIELILAQTGNGPAGGAACNTRAAGGSAGLQAGAVHGDDSPIWDLHSGGGRYDRVRWTPAHFDRAIEAAGLFSAKARVLHRELVSRPGELVPSEELADLLDVPGAHGVAGVMNGFSKASDELDMAFPLFWFERPDGTALYGVPPAIADLFAEVYVALGVEPIRARTKRWYREVVPAAVEVLAENGRNNPEDPRIRYGGLATAVRDRVPGARVPNRGRVMGWLLEDVSNRMAAVDDRLPLLTSLVVTGAQGKPSTGFRPIYEKYRGKATGDYVRREQQACVEYFTPEATDDLVAKLRALE